MPQTRYAVFLLFVFLTAAGLNAAGSWDIATVDTEAIPSSTLGEIGQYTSIAVDSLGDSHISCYEASMGALIYVFYNSGTGKWASQIVDNSVALVGKYSSIALKGGNPSLRRISYYDETNGDLKFAKSDGGAWTTVKI
ncbi:MAG: hypothetical protein PHQ23_17085, partial [Candidatus Wallbacteria bacterium]|nr:hypothetical protein [Candidatus Wallbacteria bacterium]